MLAATMAGPAGNFAVITRSLSTGGEVSRTLLDGTGTVGTDAIEALAIDASGDIVAAGRLDKAGTDGTDLFVARFAGPTGAELSRKVTILVIRDVLSRPAMKARMRVLEAQINAIKRELATLGDLRPGSLSRQYNVCASVGCRCRATPPQKHGPYYHLSYTRHGKGGTRLIRPADLPTIRAAVANYARLKRLVDRWIDLATERSDLTLQLRAAADPSRSGDDKGRQRGTVR